MWGLLGRILSFLFVAVIVGGLIAFLRYPDLIYRFAAGSVASYREKVEGELAVEEGGQWMPAAKGVERRVLTVTRGGDYPLDLYALRLDPTKVRIEVVNIKPGELGKNPIGVLAEKTDALAMMNASFFNDELGILGLCISKGEEVSPLVKAGDHRGIFITRGQTADVVERDRFNPSGVDNAVQSGPWLVRDGRALDDFGDADRVTRRTCVGVDKTGRILFVVTDTVVSGITLKHLAHVLAMPTASGGLGAVRALNLDGGTSSQLVLRSPTDTHLIRGFVNVPVLLGVYPRTD